MDTEARVHGIEALGAKVYHLGIGLDETHSPVQAELPSASLRPFEHRRREIDAYDAAGRANRLGEVEHRRSAPAANAEHASAGQRPEDSD